MAIRLKQEQPPSRKHDHGDATGAKYPKALVLKPLGRRPRTERLRPKAGRSEE
jgi:hypothetical protein